MIDACGTCNDNFFDDCTQDCSGEWGGDLVNDPTNQSLGYGQIRIYEDIARKRFADLDKSIYGGGSNLDSLGLVSFIIGLEQNIEDKFDYSISLADEKAMSQKSNPYNNINSLADYILKSLPKN